MEIEFDKSLFEQYYKSLCHFGWKLCGDMTQAEDFAQDAFIAYFKKRNDISTNEFAIQQFLYTSVRYSFLNLKRKEKVEARYWGFMPFDEHGPESLELDIIRSEVIAEVYKIVSSLPSGCQAVFKMGYFDGLTNQEIAKVLHISVNTVKTQKQRGLQFVMKKLHPEFLPIFLMFLPFI